jgi:hypothetical protein
MRQELRVKNYNGEELDVLIEGNESAYEIVVFVHGFGTDKGEGHHLFAELADYLSEDFLLLRFDQSGYGKSGGLQSEANPAKAAQDLDVILQYVWQEYTGKRINIYAHSLGTLVTSILSPIGIDKSVFTGAISPNLKDTVDRFVQRIESRGGTVDKSGVSVYPHYSGVMQEIGSEFWRVLERTDFVELLNGFANKTNLTVIKSKQDQIVGDGPEFDAYKQIYELDYIELQGDHNYADKEDRRDLFKRVKDLLSTN